MNAGRRKASYPVAVVTIWLSLAAGLMGMLILGLGYIPFINTFSNPSLDALPQPIKITTAPPDGSTELTAFGYSTRLPWNSIFTRIDGEHIRGIIFNNGIIVQMHRPDAVVGWRAEFLKPENRFVLNTLEKVFGASCCRDNFQIVSLILKTRPGQIRLLQLPKTNRAMAMLLTYKQVVIGPEPKQILSFETGSVKGFQIGLPEQAPVVRLLLYPDGMTEVKLEIFAEKTAVLQNEINGIIARFKPVPPARQ